MAKDYYNGNDCFEAMRSVLTPEELRGFCVGNAFKYIWRHHDKGGREDLEKAADYLDRALKLDDAPNTDQGEWVLKLDAPRAESGMRCVTDDERHTNVGKSGVWIKRRNGYVCPFCGAQTHEPAATCYSCGASLDVPDEADGDRPVNVGKTGTWIKIATGYYCPFCGKLAEVGDDHPETLTCPNCLAVLSFEEGNDENDV